MLDDPEATGLSAKGRYRLAGGAAFPMKPAVSKRELGQGNAFIHFIGGYDHEARPPFSG
jgi:hypothetical protein